MTKQARVVEEVVLPKNATERDQAAEAVERRSDVKVGRTADRPADKR